MTRLCPKCRVEWNYEHQDCDLVNFVYCSFLLVVKVANVYIYFAVNLFKQIFDIDSDESSGLPDLPSDDDGDRGVEESPQSPSLSETEISHATTDHIIPLIPTQAVESSVAGYGANLSSPHSTDPVRETPSRRARISSEDDRPRKKKKFTVSIFLLYILCYLIRSAICNIQCVFFISASQSDMPRLRGQR